MGCRNNSKVRELEMQVETLKSVQIRREKCFVTLLSGLLFDHTRAERTIDLLFSQYDTDSTLSGEALRHEIQATAPATEQNFTPIPLIRMLREVTGCGLLEGKKMVDSLRQVDPRGDYQEALQTLVASCQQKYGLMFKPEAQEPKKEHRVESEDLNKLNNRIRVAITTCERHGTDADVNLLSTIVVIRDILQSL